jgi:hypothetical protein
LAQYVVEKAFLQRNVTQRWRTEDAAKFVAPLQIGTLRPASTQVVEMRIAVRRQRTVARHADRNEAEIAEWGGAPVPRQTSGWPGIDAFVTFVIGLVIVLGERRHRLQIFERRTARKPLLRTLVVYPKSPLC